ncbi:efflux RND transporter permease subunit [Endozoicomonas montiporae]|nr:efflux RND transporter permease subunit [Endozoicomonas montiporae]
MMSHNHDDSVYKKGVIAWFANNPVAANLLMLTIIVAGLLSTYSIKKTIFPDFAADTIQVSVSYPGAGADDIEQSVVLKIEEAVRDLSGIKKVVSTAREGLGRVRIEVETGFDLDTLYNDVKVSVEGLTTLPVDVETPVITKIEPENRVLLVTVFGDIERLSLQRTAQSLQEALLTLPTVTKTRLLGEDDLEISIQLSESALRKYGLTFDEVARALKSASIDVAGGSIKTRDGDISVKTRGQAYTGFDFADFVVRTNADGSRLYLRDIADIHDGFVEDEGIVRFNGREAITISVISEGDISALQTSRDVRHFLGNYQSQLPVSVEARPWGDGAYYLKSRLNMMMKNMLSGGVLVFLLLTLFLRMRVAFWVVVGIPVCFLGAIWLMPNALMPVSINMLSLFGFILVLGVVVDDAIIMGESAYTSISRYGHTTDNVVAGVHRVVVPATFGVLTTMAAFLPVLFVTGQASPFFHAIGLVVILCLFFSLVESKLILPAHLAHMRKVEAGKPPSNRLARLQNRVDHGLQWFVNTVYQPLMEKALRNRYVTLSVFAGVMIITVSVMVSPLIRFVFFPKIPSDMIEVTLDMHAGVSIADRNDTLIRLEQAAMRVDERYRQENEGETLVESLMLWSRGDDEGVIIAELSKAEARSIEVGEVANLWRDEAGAMVGVQKLDFSTERHAGGSKPVYFRLSSNDNEQLQKAAAELEAQLRSYRGVYDVENTTESAIDEVILDILPGAQALGLNLASLGNQVRQGFYGQEVQKIQRGREEVKVILRYPREDRDDLTDLDRVRIRTADGSEVPFYQVATITPGQGTSYIRRTNGKRALAVSANVDVKRIEPDTVIKDVRENFLPDLYARYPDVASGLDGASLEQKQTVKQLSVLGSVALLMIYALIAIPLRSYVQPLLIMAIIPFGLVGALIGHLLMGKSFSLMSTFGLIALAGVLVNDSLILVDFINKAKATGKSVYEAAIYAGRERFRAIILTSLTTFLGLVPITMEKSLQAQAVSPMAISLGFGILFATAITLILTPTLYVVISELGQGFRRLWHGAGSAKPVEDK